MIWFPPFDDRGRRERSRVAMYDPIAIDPAATLVPLADVDPDALAAAIAAERARLAPDLPRFAAIGNARDVRAYVAATRIATMSGRWLDFALIVDGAIAGVLGLHEIDPFARSACVACWLRTAHDDGDLATRALDALVALAFRDYAVTRVDVRVAGAAPLRYVRVAASDSTSTSAYAAIPLPSPV